MLKNKQNKTEYPTFLGPVKCKTLCQTMRRLFSSWACGRQRQADLKVDLAYTVRSRTTRATEDTLPQTNKQQKDCCKSLILICYTAMNNHMPMYPVPFWALLSLTAWSCTAAQDNLVLRATLSLCLLSLEIAGYTTPVFYLCLSTVFPNGHRGIQSSKWVTELLKSIFPVPHLFFCVPVTAIALLVFLVV